MKRSTRFLALAIVAVLAAGLWLALRGKGVDHAAAAMPDTSTNPRSVPPMVLVTPLPAPEPTAPSPSPVIPAPVSKDDAQSAPTQSAPPSLILYGFLRPAPSHKALVDGAVALTDPTGQRQLAHCGADGGYSFSGLAPGHYFVGAWSPRNGSAGVELDLDASTAERRLDLQLVVPYEVVVKAVDREGRPIEQVGLMPVATEEAPAGWLDELTSNDVEHYGVGSFRKDGPFIPGEGDVELGTLSLDHPPPVYVSLVTYQHVIATKLVEPGQIEVEFVVDRNLRALQSGSLQARFVDAASHAAIDSVSVMLDGFGTRGMQKKGDSFQSGHLLPGWYRIQVHAHGYESLGRRVLVAAGTETDLGDVALEHEQWISGTVVDADGHGCVMRLRWTEYDREKGAAPTMGTVYVVNSKADGSFRIGGLSRGLYLVRTMSREETSFAGWSKVIDTTAGPVENVKVQLAIGVPLVLRASDPASRSSVRYKIVDESGTAVRLDRFWNPEPVRLSLAPGKYVVEVTVEKGKEPKRIPITIASQTVELAIP